MVIISIIHTHHNFPKYSSTVSRNDAFGTGGIILDISFTGISVSMFDTVETLINFPELFVILTLQLKELPT